MNAEEAAKIANSARESIYNTALSVIMNTIKDRAERGFRSAECSLDEAEREVSYRLIDALKKLGYKVYETGRAESLIIRWC